MIIHTLLRRRGWVAILLAGLAFSMGLETVILQTSVSPAFQGLLFGNAPNQNFLSPFGVNLGYLLWALGYESLWAIVIPIQLTGLLFPDRCYGPWIGRKGLITAAIIFLVPALGVWYQFTQVGIGPGLAYEAPIGLVLPAILIILALAALAGLIRTGSDPETGQRATPTLAGWSRRLAVEPALVWAGYLALSHSASTSSERPGYRRTGLGSNRFSTSAKLVRKRRLGRRPPFSADHRGYHSQHAGRIPDQWASDGSARFGWKSRPRYPGTSASGWHGRMDQAHGNRI